MRFVNIRGTSGSGKTTIIRELMGRFIEKCPVYITGRKQPAYYIGRFKNMSDTIAVLGHYETACGGCDTIKTLDHVKELAEQAFAQGVKTVVAEGLLLGKDVSRIVTLPDPHILYLNTPVEDCYEGVRNRRLHKALNKYDEQKKIPDEEVEKINRKPKALESDHKSIKSAVDRLRDKVTVLDVSREDSLEKLLGLLK